MPADPTYSLYLELAVGSLTDVSQSCTRASWSRSLAAVFNPMQPEPGLFELVSDQGSFSPLLNQNVTIGRRVALQATHNSVALDLTSLDANYAVHSLASQVQGFQTLVMLSSNMPNSMGNGALINQWAQSGSRRQWNLTMSQIAAIPARPKLTWSEDGISATNSILHASGAPQSLVAGLLQSQQPFALLTTFVPNDGAGAKFASWEISTDFNPVTRAGNFTLTSSISVAGVSSIANLGAPLMIGAQNSGGTDGQRAWRCLYAHVTNGVSGAIVADFTPDESSRPGLKQFTSKAGNDWTISQSYDLVSLPSSTYPQFFGRVKDIFVDAALPQRTTVLECQNEAELLSRTLLRTGILAGLQTNSLFSEIATRTGVRSFSASGMYDRVDFAWYQDDGALGAVNRLIESGFYEGFIDGAGTLTMRDRYGGGVAPSQVRSYANEFLALTHRTSIDGLANYFRVSGTPYRQETSVATLAYLAQPIPIPPLGYSGLWISYQDPRQLAVATPVGSIISLVASQDYYVSANSDGTGTDFTAQVSLSMTGFAEAAVASLYSAVNSTTVFLTRFQVRGYPILAGAELSVAQEDATSQSSYGLVQREVDRVLAPSYSHMSDYAGSLVRQQSMPQNVVQGELKNLFPDILDLELGDPLAIQNSFTGINSYWYVRGVSHEISLAHGIEHTARYELEELRAPLLRECESVFFSSTASGWLDVASPSVVASSTKLIMSAWFRQAEQTNRTSYITNATSSRLQLTIDPDGTMGGQVRQPTGPGNILHVRDTEMLSAVGSAWHHMLMAVDLANGRGQLYVDDRETVWQRLDGTFVSNPDQIDTSKQFNFHTADNLFTVGKNFGNNTFPQGTEIAEVYINLSEYMDISLAQNRRRFISSTLRPVDLGTDGSRPTGSKPEVYLSLNRRGTVVASFAANRANSAMNYAVQGTVSVGSTSPSY